MPSSRSPRIIPYLLYADVPAAIDWLSSAFGFEERLRFTSEDGTVNHAEIVLGDGVVFLSNPGAGYRNPKELGAMTHLLHVEVDDVDAQFERARAAGAPIHQEPADQPYGDRRYDAEDLGGTGGRSPSACVTSPRRSGARRRPRATSRAPAGPLLRRPGLPLPSCGRW